MVDQFIASGISAVGGAVLIYLGFNRLKKFQLINDTPDSKIRSMAMGIVELHCHAMPDKTIRTPFSQTDCVYYRYEIKEYRRHTSHTKHGTHTYYTWDTIASGEKRVLFYAEDETGRVIVNPDKAEISIAAKKAFLQKAGIFGGLTMLIKALSGEKVIDVNPLKLKPIPVNQSSVFGNNVGDRKYYEYFIEPKETLFIIGTASNENGKVMVKKGENEETFIISNKSENEMLKSYRLQISIFFIAGALMFIIGVILLLIFSGLIGG